MGGAPPAGAQAGGASSGDVAGLTSRLAEIQAAAPVTFRPDSAELTTAGQQTVDRIAQELAAVPAARVVVTGYAAPVNQGIGPAAQALSDQRAAAVVQRLGAGGVGADRVQARGAADTNPLSSTAASRRAEVAVA